MAATKILKTRVTPDMKARVAEITGGALLTEAVWLRRLIARAIQDEAVAAAAGGTRHYTDDLRGECPAGRGRASRLYVRLRREDRLLLHERAAARGMASATYVSVLLRAHLRALTPLPKDELAALVAADCNVTHPVEVKVDHLGEDGGFGTADADSGASSGDTGVEASGLEHSRDCSRDRAVASDGTAVFARSSGSWAIRPA